MTDAELAAIVAQLAVIEHATKEGLEATIELARKLEIEPEFAGLPSRSVRNGRGSSAVLPDMVAQKMLYIARERDAAAAVAWLRKIPTLNRGSGGAVKALYGVDCSGRIALSDDILLVPYLDLPQSSTRDWIHEEHIRSAEWGRLRTFTPAPKAALLRPGTIEPLTVEVGADLFTSPSSRWFDDLDTAALLLALVPKAIPLEAAHWFNFDDPDVALLCESGIHVGTEAPPWNTVPVQVTSEAVTGLLSAYRRMSKGDQNRIDLALRRVIRARGERNPANRAIDLSIVLEVIFMNADRDEHSYKISLRVSRLLKTSYSDRRKTFVEVRKLYDMRSSMVHRSSASNSWSIDGKMYTAYELVESVDLICADAIRKFLDLGEIPSDWREIELSDRPVQEHQADISDISYEPRVPTPSASQNSELTPETGSFRVTGLSATLTTREHLSISHLLAAAKFSRLVGELERAHAGQTVADFWDEIQSYAIGCVLTAIAGLEAYANELFVDATKNFPKVNQSVISKMWELYEGRSTLEKFEFALLLRERPPMSRGVSPYQDIAALTTLRNGLVHFKPESSDEKDEHLKISAKLQPHAVHSPFLASTSCYSQERGQVMEQQNGLWRRPFHSCRRSQIWQGSRTESQVLQISSVQTRPPLRARR
jgi:Apea-like HEPN